MQPFNVEIFDRQFNLIQHYNIDSIEYEFDYLSLGENRTLVPFNEDVKRGLYIRISNPVYEYFGIITTISIDNTFEGFSDIRFKPFMSLFDTNVVIDTTLGSDQISLEQLIIDAITTYFIDSVDEEQAITGLSIIKLTDTLGWSLVFEEEAEGAGKAVINLLKDLIQPALVRNRVALYITPNFTSQTITIHVGIKDSVDFKIEAELPNVIAKNVILNQTTKEVNKLFVYNEADFSQSATYYLHNDGTFDTNNTDRVTPVMFDIKTINVKEGETFSDCALEAAKDTFGDIFAANLIEIKVLNDDWLVKASTMEIGQLVSVILNGAVYQSVLTGFKRKDCTELTFGTIRMDLTKILKEALK